MAFKFELDWEVSLFKLVWSAAERLKASRQPQTGEPVTLASAERRLVLLARALCDRQIIIQPTDGWGYTDGAVIFLPHKIDLLPTADENLALYRLAMLQKAQQIRSHSLEPATALIGNPLAKALYALIDGERCRRLLQAEFPSLAETYDHAMPLLAALQPKTLGAKAQAVSAFAKLLLGDDPATLPTSGAVSCARALHRELPQRLDRWTADVSIALALWGAERIGALPGRYRAPAGVPIWGDVVPEALPRLTNQQDAKQGSAADPPEESDAIEEQEQSVASERRIRAKVAEIDEDAANKAILFNRFEQVETAEDYFGMGRPIDDDGEIQSHTKVLDELDLDQVIRSGRRVKSIYRAELEVEESSGRHLIDTEPPAQALRYPEWFSKENAYRDDWCWLFEKEVPPGPASWATNVLETHAWTLAHLKKRFKALNPEFVRFGRQMDGEEADLDAVVEARADLRAGLQPSERLYMNRLRRRRDLAVAFLVDCSSSTDSWVMDRRILDLEKEALLLMGEALDTVGDAFAMYGFSSRTRKHCQFYPIKDFNEPYGPRTKARIAGLQARDYTRIGPPLRHLIKRFETVSASRKVLFLISDGKPNDFDVYEGRHGIGDVRKALDEARSQGIRPFCVTVDSQARRYLPQMFGPNGYLILDDLSQLPKRLPEAFLRLAGQ